MSRGLSLACLAALSLAPKVSAGIWLWIAPTLFQCGDYGSPWGTDGNGPYTVKVLQQGSEKVLESWPAKQRQEDDQWHWTVDIPAGTAIFFSFTDGSGQEARNYERTVEGSPNVDCLGRNSGLTDYFHQQFDAKIADLKAAQEPSTTVQKLDPPPQTETSSTLSPTRTSQMPRPAPTVTSSTSMVKTSKNLSTFLVPFSNGPQQQSSASPSSFGKAHSLSGTIKSSTDVPNSLTSSLLQQSVASTVKADVQPADQRIASGEGSSPSFASVIGATAAAVAALTILVLSLVCRARRKRRSSQISASQIAISWPKQEEDELSKEQSSMDQWVDGQCSLLSAQTLKTSSPLSLPKPPTTPVHSFASSHSQSSTTSSSKQESDASILLSATSKSRSRVAETFASVPSLVSKTRNSFAKSSTFWRTTRITARDPFEQGADVPPIPSSGYHTDARTAASVQPTHFTWIGAHEQSDRASTIYPQDNPY